MNLIFDFDGVIADSEEAFNATLFKAFQKAGFPYSREEIESHTDLQYFETIRLLAKNKRSTVTTYLLEGLIDCIHRGDYLFPYAKEALNKLAKGNDLFVVSNSYQKLLDECAKVYQLKFVEVVGRSKRFLKKIAGIKYLLEKHRMNFKETAYVGDSVGDIKLARDVGVKAFAVYSGWDSKEELEAAKPDEIFKNIEKMSNQI
jgi:phosphoglycolate phosphatase-like HAD superfamily hydrolase